MMNVKDFTDAEFLSFLYSEKSREIENNAVPGWNKWAIYGTIATTVIYLYYAITNNYKNYDYRIFSMYIIGLSAIFLYLLIYKRLNSDVKTYIQSKVRPLIKEAPILLYVFQLIINSVLALIQFYWNSLSVIFFGIIIALIINVFILIYIIKNRNKFVLAKLKIQVLNNLKIDVLVHSFLGGIYTLIIVTTLIYLIKEPKSFYHSEFELAFGITTLTILIYLLLKIIKKNNNVSDELDRLINKFVIGSISKEEAYNKYILIMYGLSAYQAIEKDLEIINDIKNNYDNKIDVINDIKKRIESNSISTTDIKTLQDELAYYKKANSSLSKLLNKITEITKLGIPAIADEKFKEVIKEYEKTSKLLSNLIEQTMSVSKEFDNQVSCKKFGGVCLNKECSNRNDRMLLKHKI